ncbi:hypothetical protein FACS189490_10360 [Clostridia bacterium]|nr:hypothetical protein FACS189490_10360 [Clostridia bacterium]
MRGLYGGGKTISLVYYLEQMRRKYGDKICIMTNFFYEGQDAPMTGWKALLEEYDRPVIFAYDELQNDFLSRESKNFPAPLMGEITQTRKGHGKQIVYTTQTFSTVDKAFRNLTTDIVLCKTFFGRLTKFKYYRKAAFEQRESTVSIDSKIKIRPYKKVKFVQSDYLRNRYDSYKRLLSFRNVDFADRRIETD